MKKTIFVLALLAANLFSQGVVHFPPSWKFTSGDSAAYSRKDWDDKGWDMIQVPAQWETQGFAGLDGFGWYRMRFKMQKYDPNEEYFLLAGKIDDADETFLNGKKIGGMGAFPPKASSEWNSQRIYSIPKKLLAADNVLAVRVFDMGGPGGIQNGEFGVYSKKALAKLLNTDGKPVKSFPLLVNSNGLIAAVYNENSRSLENVFPHIFQAYDDKNSVQPFAANISFNLKENPVRTCYLANTHVIFAEYKDKNIYYIAPFTLDKPVYIIAAESKKKEKVTGLSLAFEKRKYDILFDTLLTENGAVTRKFFLISFKDSLRDNAAAITECKRKITENPAFVEKEAGYMLSVFGRCKMPAGISKSERDIIEQSVSVLKMAQVSQSEVFAQARGQIIASLPPGIWNISWLRDGCYSLSALVKLTLYDEARDYIKFLLGADCGYYKQFRHTDGLEYGIGQDYKLSVCRYFGTGKEESDFNENGPNIELDGFGLFLNSFTEYVRAAGDKHTLVMNLRELKQKIADVLVNSIADNGLVRKDSGPWERHLPGKQVAYTSITAAKGLLEFGKLLKDYQLPGGDKYADCGLMLARVIKQWLVTDSLFVKGTLEAKSIQDFEFLDAAAYEAFNFLPGEFSGLFLPHHKYYSKYLKLMEHRGYKRVNGGDWYDKQEWVFLDCRIICALKKNGMEKEAAGLKQWIIKQAELNNNLIPELYNEVNAKYEGAIPMVGFGAGSFILTFD